MGNLNYNTPQVQQRIAQGYYDDIKAAGYGGTKAQLDAILAKAGLAATQSAPGQMSAADKKKLDGIATGANNYTLPKSASATLGGIKTGYATSGKNYAIQVDTNGNAYVNVPWSDTNTTYSVVGANGSTGLVKNGSTVTSASGYTACPIVGGVPYYKDTNTTYSVVGGNGSTGLVKNGSTVTSTSGYTACPIVGGVPYYKDTNTTYGVASTTNDGLMGKSDKTKLNSCPTATGLTKIQKITQSAYDALSTKDANTLYIIVG